QIVEDNYQKVGTNYTAEEAKAKIREEVLRPRELTEARKEAAAFAQAVFATVPENSTNNPNPGALQMLANSNNLPVTLTPPFDREEGPRDLKVGPEFVRAAFGLAPDSPFSEPIVGRDAVYVMALLKRLPSEVPALETIRDQVTSDYKLIQAADLARKAGAEV